MTPSALLNGLVQLIQSLGFRAVVATIITISALPLVWLALSLPTRFAFKALALLVFALGLGMLAGGPLRSLGVAMPPAVARPLFLCAAIAVPLLIVQLGRVALLLPALLAKPLWGAPLAFLLSGQLSLVLLGAGVCLGAIGFWNTISTPDVREVRLPIANLPPELEGFHIVQLSDLHLGTIFDAAWLAPVVQKANALNADIVAVTGDAGEAAPEIIAADLAPLAALRAKEGVYTSLGNHETYQGLDAWLAYYPTMSTLLRNSHVLIRRGDATLALAGLDDGEPDIAAALAGAPENAVRVVLGHRPDRAPACREAGVDLYLGGHTHGGLTPLLRLVVARGNKGYVAGAYELDGMWIYINPGTGLWSYVPLRVDNPAEITSIRLTRAPEKS